MPADTNVIPSVDFQLRTGGNPVGGGTGATLTVGRAIETGPHDRYAGWQDGAYSTRSHQLAFEALYLEGAGGPPPVLSGADVAFTVGGQPLKGLREVTLNLTQEVQDVVNAATGLDRRVRSGARKAAVTIAGDYYDPAAVDQAAYAAVLDELMGATSAGLQVAFTVGGIAVSFRALATQGTVEKSVPDVLKAGLTLESVGAVLNTTANAEPGMAAVLAAFFGAAADGSDPATPIDYLIGTTTPENTEFAGSGLFSDLTIAAPMTGRVTVSGTLQGDGALVRRATPAPVV